MARGLHVHAVALPTPQVGWSPSRGCFFVEDEPTKRVPDYLTALALSVEENLLTDSDTIPTCGVATNTLEALEALEARELAGAFDSIDQLESARPSALESGSVQVHKSGVVPVGTSLPLEMREVIPPPPRRPTIPELLEAFTQADAPFHAEADNQQGVVNVDPSRRPASTTRAVASRCVASAVFALVALLVLVAIGQRPVVMVHQVARSAVTLHGRAAPSVSRSATVANAPRSATVFVATAPRFPSPPAPTRVAKTPAATGHIIRNAPF